MQYQHKSQGSEYPVVIFLYQTTLHDATKKPNLHGLTRDKKKVIFVGDPAAYAMAIRNDKTLVRQTISTKTYPSRSSWIAEIPIYKWDEDRKKTEVNYAKVNLEAKLNTQSINRKILKESRA